MLKHNLLPRKGGCFGCIVSGIGDAKWPLALATLRRRPPTAPPRSLSAWNACLAPTATADRPPATTQFSYVERLFGEYVAVAGRDVAVGCVKRTMNKRRIQLVRCTHPTKLQYARMSLARDLIRDRKGVGLSQQKLADLADVRQETLSRIETGKHTASEKTVDKIMRVIES